MKNIIICCDGTGNEYGDHNTNVVITYELSVKEEAQVGYYDPGVGTGGWDYTDEGKDGTLRAKFDLASGNGLQKNIEDAYRFLMQRYEREDRIYLFGFSRGAFTVRALAGMLHKCGLLEADMDNLVEYAGKMYNRGNNGAEARGFRQTFCRACPIHFVGVWDTVSSLALDAGQRFHDVRLNPEVSHGYHAIAIDEKRKDFPVMPWDEDELSPGQTIEQVWFAGVHSDVGGWYEERGLSNTALHWMLGKAAEKGARFDFDRAKREYVPDSHDKLHKSREGMWRWRPRSVRKVPEGALVHRSVVDRRDNPVKKYEPKLPAKFTIVE